MDIVAILTRAVDEYRKQHGRRPGRIVLSRDAALALAAEMVRRNENIGTPSELDTFKPTADEVFLGGGVAFFKTVPVIAEIPPDEVLVVG